MELNPEAEKGLASEELSARLAAILALDVVGFTTFISGNSPTAVSQFIALRNQIERGLPQFGGRIFKNTGDGCLVEFNQVNAAVECAVSLQEAMLNRNKNLSEDQRIQIRIGIAVGDVFVDGDDLLGDTINIAARLQSIAKPGCIAISHAAIEGRPIRGIPMRTHGHLQLKNLTHSVLTHEMLFGSEAENALTLGAVRHESRCHPIIIESTLEEIRLKTRVKKLSKREASMFLHEIPPGRYFYHFRLDLVERGQSAEALHDAQEVQNQRQGSYDIEIHKVEGSVIYFIAYFSASDISRLKKKAEDVTEEYRIEYTPTTRFKHSVAIPLGRITDTDSAYTKVIAIT